MATYTVEIVERLCKLVEVEAENEERALKKVRRMYRNEEIILDSSDMYDKSFEVIDKVDD